jgi:tetratricopeptide (TPR) repeat protein
LWEKDGGIFMEKGELVLEGKGEVVGNLTAAKLSGGNIEFFSFGEYFEANPLLEVVEPHVQLKHQIWSDGVIHSLLTSNYVTLRVKMAAHSDTLTYSIQNLSQARINLRVRGGLSTFSWFNPDFRSKIAEMANVRFNFYNGVLEGSYGDSYFICATSNGLMTADIKYDYATYEIKSTLSPSELFIFTVSGDSSKERAVAYSKAALANPQIVEDMRRRWVKDIVSKVPKLNIPKPEYALLWKYMWYVILANRATVWNNPALKNPFTMPSKFAFRHQWLWDSSFHAIVLSSYDIKMAEEELLNLFENQKPDGRIPHEIFLSKEFCKLFWAVDDYSPWTTQPPVLAIAVKRIMDLGGEREFLTKAFKVLDRYDRWFRAARDADKDQLMAYVDYLESGWDNAVRWDEAIRLFEENPSKYKSRYERIRMAPVEAVDLNCLIYIQRKVLAELAEKLGLHEKAGEYSRLANETANKVVSYMWDPETRFFFDVFEENHEQIKVKSPAAFLTLYAGIASKEQAESLVKHLLNPKEFWTKFPIPTVSADHKEYDPKGYWRGRSWINILWFTYNGLKTYGFMEEAKQLAERALNIMSSGPTCNENYNSLTGEPLGAQDFSWSTLMTTILMDIYST